jgi:hypothetical protein
MRRSGSDEEFLRRVGLIRFHRADSEGSESDASNSDKKKPAGDGKMMRRYVYFLINFPEQFSEKEAFDGIDDLPKLENRLKNKHIRTLGEIGKTRSVGDLQKKTKITKTFQQMNIVKLPRCNLLPLIDFHQIFTFPSVQNLMSRPSSNHHRRLLAKSVHCLNHVFCL